MFRPQNLFLFLTKYFLILNFACAEEESLSPKALFQAIFLEEDSFQRFVYAPLGNPFEENASLITLPVSSKRLSDKFVYFGESPLKIFKKRDQDDGAGELRGKEIKLGEQLELAYEYQFSPLHSTILKEILLLGDPKNGKLNCSSISFSPDEVPIGSYQFQSFSNENFFISVGGQKLALKKGESKIINLLDVKESSVRLVVYLLRKNEYEKSYSRKIINHAKKRGVFFLRSSQKIIDVMAFIDSEGDRINRAIGYEVMNLTLKSRTHDSNQ